jgi:N-acyl-D-amino-acid deacylase
MRAWVRLFFLAAAAGCLAGTAAAWPGGHPAARAPVGMTGQAAPGLGSFDRLMTTFLADRDLPGAALAVGRRGRVVYSRGFGYADRETRRPVRPETLFRIASVSKPITAAAVLQLVEKKRLRLDDRVFGLLELKAPAKGFDPRWERVTVAHLLSHRGGWDRAKTFDPMLGSDQVVAELGVAPPAMPGAVIRYMLGKPLQFDPGSREAYSNFGYCLLGRVVEKASGQGYEAYVRQHVLAPLGIKTMRLGRTLAAWPGESAYHDRVRATAVMGPRRGQPVARPYGSWCLEAMDAHGGWVASAADLVRFGMAFDDPRKCKILKASSVRRMFAPPTPEEGKKDVYYAMGWSVRPDQCDGRPNTFHGGLLDGTSALLVRRCDGLTWAVLFNASKGKTTPAGAIDGLLHRAADAVKTWPK